MKKCIILLLMLVLLGILCMNYLQRKKGIVNKKQIEEFLKSNIKIGDEKLRVEVLLKSQNIEYSWDENKNMLHGIMRNIREGLLTAESIEIEVSFDNHHKVECIKVTSVFTGP